MPKKIITVDISKNLIDLCDLHYGSTITDTWGNQVGLARYELRDHVNIAGLLKTLNNIYKIVVEKLNVSRNTS